MQNASTRPDISFFFIFVGGVVLFLTASYFCLWISISLRRVKEAIQAAAIPDGTKVRNLLTRFPVRVFPMFPPIGRSRVVVLLLDRFPEAGASDFKLSPEQAAEFTAEIEHLFFYRTLARFFEALNRNYPLLSRLVMIGLFLQVLFTVIEIITDLLQHHH